MLALCSSLAFGQLKEAGNGGAGPVQATHLKVQLVADPAVVAPGGTTTAGLILTLEDHWHVYWINAGDAGEPPEVQWSLPVGVVVGAIQFPTPSRLSFGPLMDYGYEGVAAFPIKVQVGRGVKPGRQHLDAHVRWLVCREVCIPGRAHLGLDLQITTGAPDQPPVGVLAQALQKEPQALPVGTTVALSGSPNQLTLTLVTGRRESQVEFYPLDEDIIRNAADQPVEPLANGARLQLERDDPKQPLPSKVRGVIKLTGGRAYLFETAVTEAGSMPTKGASQLTAIAAVGLGLLGGILLNLMPCVFPVLFLKGLSLVQSSEDEHRRMRRHGFAYTLGILASFWLVVLVLLALRATGRQAGWGFQMQSPIFVVLMTFLLFFMALSLAGLFDVGLSLASAGDSLTRRQGYEGSFFTGVLATIVATPCTAPLMGAAIGFALAQPPVTTFVVFTALGLGLALPYLLLTLQPAWVRWLPQPGAWMETLKQLTAVPLFATVVWLIWVYGHLDTADAGQSADHTARLLLGLLVVSIAGWTLGRWPARRWSALAGLALCIVAAAIPLTAQRHDSLQWQPFSAVALQQARSEGRPVFIDFTAAWCLSCQVNERLVLRRQEVEQELAQRHFLTMRADWTQYDPEITSQLASVGRSGVPTYVIYGAGGQADVLPELLTKSAVLQAIDRTTQRPK